MLRPQLSTLFLPRIENAIQASLPCLWFLHLSKVSSEQTARIATSMLGRACQGWEGRVAAPPCVPGMLSWQMVPKGLLDAGVYLGQLLGYLSSH